MALADLLKQLLGATKAAPTAGEKFQILADSSGLNFCLSRDEYRRLRAGEAPPYLKAQATALRMLEEQGLAASLPNGFTVTAEDVAALESDVAELLGLPARFPGEFEARIRGYTKSSSFKVDITARVDGKNFPIRRRGPLLELSESERYWLTAGELFGLTANERHSSSGEDAKGETANLRLMAELQTATRSGMRMDLSQFDRLDVVIPQGIGVMGVEMADGSLQLCPSLGDGSTPEELGQRWGQIDLESDRGVMRVNNRIVLLDQKKLAAVKEVLGNRRIPAGQVADFMKTPSAFLDAALVDLELGFSVRVAGVGPLQHMDFAPLDATRSDWFGFQKTVRAPEQVAGLLQSPEEVERFKRGFDAAISQGAEEMVFDGERIAIADTGVIREQIRIAEDRLLALPRDEEKSEEADDAAGTREKVTLLLQDMDEIRTDLLARASESTPTPEIPWTEYAREPYQHQREGVEWLLSMIQLAMADDINDAYRVQGALLADDMGLGKTFMTLVAVNEYLRIQGNAGRTEKPILVVAPLSLLENWEEEVAKTYDAIPFRDIVVLQGSRDLRRFRVAGMPNEQRQLSELLNDDDRIPESSIRYALQHGPEAGPARLDMDRRLVLTTYQTLRDYQFSLCRIDWGLVVFDEAQNIKNPVALQTRAAKGLKADFKLLATGTPVENTLGDFWCLFDAAQPGLLGTWPQFRDRFVKPIVEATADERESIRMSVGSELRKAVGPYMLRRIKEDQLRGLPSKTIHAGVEQPSSGNTRYEPDLAREMDGRQLTAYDEAIDGYRRARDAEGKRGQALAVLQKLRTISLHPRTSQERELMVHGERAVRSVMSESGKLAVLLGTLDEIAAKSEKVILFLVNKQIQRLLKLWLDQVYDLDIAIVNGDTKAVAGGRNTTTRKGLIRTFEAKPGFNILIMSPVAAGVGLTVVGANHVVHVERHWNPAKEAQASDRVYRIGQEKDVHIHLPAVLHPGLDSFDVHLDRLLRGKVLLKDAVVTPEAVSEDALMESLGL
jgi:hypothetical protein